MPTGAPAPFAPAALLDGIGTNQLRALRVVDVLPANVSNAKQRTTANVSPRSTKRFVLPVSFRVVHGLISPTGIVIIVHSLFFSVERPRTDTILLYTSASVHPLEGQVDKSSRGYVIKSFGQSAYFLSPSLPPFHALILDFFQPYFAHKNTHTPNRCPQSGVVF